MGGRGAASGQEPRWNQGDADQGRVGGTRDPGGAGGMKVTDEMGAHVALVAGGGDRGSSCQGEAANWKAKVKQRTPGRS